MVLEHKSDAGEIKNEGAISNEARRKSDLPAQNVARLWGTIATEAKLKISKVQKTEIKSLAVTAEPTSSKDKRPELEQQIVADEKAVELLMSELASPLCDKPQMATHGATISRKKSSTSQKTGHLVQPLSAPTEKDQCASERQKTIKATTKVCILYLPVIRYSARKAQCKLSS